jgi:two-component system cell cycle sensor histidine kinase/response regulator CckA
MGRAQKQYRREDNFEMNPFEPSELPPSTAPGNSASAAVERPTVIELHTSEEMASALLESAAQAIISTDRAGRMVLANRHAEEMFGYSREELLGSSIDILLPEPKGWAHAQKRGEYLNQPRERRMGSGMDLFARRKDGSVFPVDVGLSHMETTEGVFAIAFVSDISERKQLEEQLMHAQKMEAIGRLAASVAHDFNNMLTTISGYGAMALEELPAQNPLRDHVGEILEAANRAATLTGQLLAFGRRQIMRPQVISLNTLIANTEKMLRLLIGEDVVLELILEAGLGTVKADPGHIEQAIVNLVVNSRDAMPAGGRIIVETANVSLDEHYAKTRIGVRPGEFVMVAVSDTGDGMDAGVQRRIFEPFFTTKEQGKGTGLGLATVYGTMKQTGGDIWVHSELGKGTTFKLYFPKVDIPITALPTAAVRPGPRGDETILVVEDEPSVRSITAKMLAQLGYETLSATCGAEALEMSKAHSGTIHLLLTDVVMPNMNGPQLADELAGARPDMKVLYLSGYTESVAVHHGIVDSSAPFLAKPFSRDVLAKTIRDVLENRRLRNEEGAAEWQNNLGS